MSEDAPSPDGPAPFHTTDLFAALVASGVYVTVLLLVAFVYVF